MPSPSRALFRTTLYSILTVLAVPARAADELRLAIGDAKQWQFVGGTWTDQAGGEIAPPGDAVDEHAAFYLPDAFGDFTAEFDFRQELGFADGGFIFRAQDAQHYYLVHFPCTGQQLRAKHFWAAVSKVDGNSWLELLRMEYVPGAPSELKFWHNARLVVQGDELRLWVDGRPLSTIRDASFRRPGRIGLAASASHQPGRHCTIRNLVVRGRPAPSAAWHEQRAEPTWFVVDAAAGTGCSNIVRAANRDLVAMVEHALLRSSDNGRSWTRSDTLPKEFGQQSRELYLGSFHVRRDDVIDIHTIEDRPPFRILRFSSRDHGRTWSPPESTGQVDVPPGGRVEHVWPQSMLKLRDGALLWFAYTAPPEKLVAGETYPLEQNGRQYELGRRRGSMSICLRSTDEGRTWAKPVDLDGANPLPQASTKPIPGSEVSSGQTREGTVVTLIRPDDTPYMWESRSSDGGRSWTPAAPGPFAMYAGTQSMIGTSSGALLFGARHPGMAVRASFDNGMTWRGYRVDTTSWGNGAMVEVAPDIVLYVYGAHIYRLQLRGQFLRVTKDGLQPMPRHQVPDFK